MASSVHAPATPRWRRRVVLTAGLSAVLATAFRQPALAATESRSVANVDEVVFAIAGDLAIEQGDRETLTVEAEPQVLPKITTEVHGRQLLIGVTPGRVETRQPIRVRLGVRSLRSLESRAVGAIRIGPLRSQDLALVLAGGGSIHLERLDDARSLDVRITGAGGVDVRGGKVQAQRLDIRGSGSYSASGLASERADVAIEGNGEVQLAASTALAVRIAGVGHVRYQGDPAVTRAISGIGTIEKL